MVNQFIGLGKDNEIHIEIGDRKFTKKGPVTVKDEEIMKALFPELSGKPIEPAKSRLERFDPQAKFVVKTKVNINTRRDEPDGEWIQLGK